MGHRFEATTGSSVRDLGKSEKTEKPRSMTSIHSKSSSDGDSCELQRGDEVLEFMKLLESSGSSDAMKVLLFKIIDSDMCEDLKILLKGSSNDMSRSKMKIGKDSNSSHDKPRRQSGRRSSKRDLFEQSNGSGHRRSSKRDLFEQSNDSSHRRSSKRDLFEQSNDSGHRRSSKRDLFEQSNGSGHKRSDKINRHESSEQSNGSGHKRSDKINRHESSEQSNGSSHKERSIFRKARTRNTEQGSKIHTNGSLTKLNSFSGSPSSSLRISSKSVSNLRKNLKGMTSPSQKSKLASSASLLHLRSSRRSDVNKRRSLVNSNQGEGRAGKQNASWDPVPGAIKIGKRRTSTGCFLKALPIAPENQNANQNATWNFPNDANGIEKVRQKKIKEKRNGLVDFFDDEDKSTAQTNLNSFAQFSPTGQVAYHEQTVRLHDLVDNLRSSRDVSNKDAGDEFSPEKKGLRKYLTRPLTKKKFTSKDKQTIVSEPANENYTILSDVSDPMTKSRSFHSPLAR